MLSGGVVRGGAEMNDGDELSHEDANSALNLINSRTKTLICI